MKVKSPVPGMKRIVSQLPGVRLKIPYVVFESDDWGSSRIHSRKALQKLEKKGLFTDDPFLQRDGLASEKDLSDLFGILSSHKDREGHHPVITANANMANPDYEKIRASDFAEYVPEPVAVTMERAGLGKAALELWREGNRRRIFCAQYHGREHLNVQFWMSALRAGHRETMWAFDQQSFGIFTETPHARSGHYLAAFDFADPQQLPQHFLILEDGLRLFRETMGYRPESFIAPQYVWHQEHERFLKDNGILVIQGHRNQLSPGNTGAGYKKRFHFTGQRSSFGQVYVSRNCFFEPCFSSQDWTDSCLREMDTAFRLRKPAVIGTHRVNYVSGRGVNSPGNHLKALDALLKRILNRWPDVRFTTTDRLGRMIMNDMKSHEPA